MAKLNERQVLAIRNAVTNQSTVFQQALADALKDCGLNEHLVKQTVTKVVAAVTWRNFSDEDMADILLGTLLSPMSRPNGLYAVRTCRNHEAPRYISKATVNRAAVMLI